MWMLSKFSIFAPLCVWLRHPLCWNSLFICEKRPNYRRAWCRAVYEPGVQTEDPMHHDSGRGEYRWGGGGRRSCDRRGAIHAAASLSPHLSAHVKFSLRVFFPLFFFLYFSLFFRQARVVGFFFRLFVLFLFSHCVTTAPFPWTQQMV